MQRHNKLYVNIIAVVLVICTLCGTAAAADLSPAVSSSPPVGVVIENSTAVFSLKDNSSQYYKYSLEIMDADKENYLLCDNFEPSETARLSNITKDSDYSLRLELYGEETVSFYEGSFSADAFDAVTVSLSKTGSKKNTEKMSETEIDSLFEMTDEQYEKVFSSLDIPSFISEDEAKAAKHVERLKEYEDSYDKIGYKNADGTNTLYIFSSPVKYMDDSGRLMDADPNISETADSTVKAQGYSYVNDYGELKTYFADSLSDNKGVKIQKNESELEFGFCVPEKKEGNTLTKLFSSVSEIFSEPKNKAMLFTENREKKLGYNEVSNDANIIASPTTSGAMQTLIFEDVPENNRLTFWVSAYGLTPKADDGKKSVIFSSESSECFTVGNIELRDSAQGEQAENGLHFSTENTVEIKQSGTDGTLVEITLDNDLLTAPSTVYPVSVTLSADSGTAVQSAETVQTAAAASEITVADAQAGTSAARTLPSEWYYDSTTCQYYQIGDEVGYSYFQDRTVFSNGAAGNADDKYLLLGYDTYYTNGYYDTTTCQNVGSGYNTCTGYVFMKCDVSSLSIDPKMVDDVQLVLREGSGNSTPMTAELVRVTSPWTENNVSINHVRNCDNEYTGNTEIVFEQSGTGIENEAEITYMVTDHLLNAKGKGGGKPNYGFLLRSTASGKFSKHICSSEHGTTSYRPKIVLLYEDPFPLELNVPGHGQILDANQNQWYSFTPTASDNYSIFTTGNTDTYGRLYDSSLNLLTSDDDSGEQLNFSISRQLEAGKTYYIRVSGLRDLDEGFYFIRVVNTSFDDLIIRDLITTDNILSTDDGFYMCSKPLSDIMIQAGVTTFVNNNGDDKSVSIYYDDWYMYAIEENSEFTYGLLKMREQENDEGDGDDPGVTISFIEFDTSILYTCLDNNTLQNINNLIDEIDRVVRLNGQTHNDIIRNYFIKPESKASYLVAQQYINHIASFVENGYIDAPNSYIDLLEYIDDLYRKPVSSGSALSKYQYIAKLKRVPNALLENNQKAGYNIYNPDNHRIYINDPQNLTPYEKYAILMMHTSNVTFNSFAAEVLYHAEMLKYEIDLNYERAIRADMAMGEEVESGITDKYYDLSSDIVQDQIQYHGEC